MSGTDVGMAGYAIKVSGVEVDAATLAAVTEIIVDGRLRLPDRLCLRLRDDDTDILDEGTFAVGASVAVTLSAPEEPTTRPVFDGQVTTLAPAFGHGATTLLVMALDRGCLLQRTPSTASYQGMSYGAIASKLASAAGLRAGTIESGVTLPYVQQSNETDWDFLWRLARDVDYEVKVVGRALNFRAAGAAGAGAAVRLTRGDGLRTFSPRVTGVGQVDSVTVRGWDPATATAITATASPGVSQSRPGAKRSSVVDALGGGEAVIVNHPVLSADHATKVADAIAARNANAYVEGEGSCTGNPAISAGCLVDVIGVGRAFSGVYAVSGVRHVLRARTGYETQFFISGREDRSLLGLATAGAGTAGPAGWAQRIVIGVVTNNEDSDGLGRVRVRYPSLDDAQEGWWARVLTPGAGAARGFATLPLVGDEVLVAFEGGSEQHPYVLGSVFNGVAKPGALSTTDGSFSCTSAKNMTFNAPGPVSMTTADALTLSAVGAAKLTNKPGDAEKGNAAVEVSATGPLDLSAGAGVTLTAVEAAALSAGTSMQISGGTLVQVKADGSVSISGKVIEIKGDTSVKISAPMVMLG
ncbi:MAG: VgrG-related protein [Conexibacter sp.]|nr:VgrG-related protein [Solirubrobacterales bacterium]MCW3004791.1 VgrG-related protein [Conexibacter sp.]